MHSNEQSLLSRINRLESEAEIRRLISFYMHLCDDLNTTHVALQIGMLFTPNASWSGIGTLYSEKMGSYQGREAIVAMMKKYVTKPPHFKINVHYLSSEAISIVNDNEATGRWKMLQVSTFNNGTSHLNGAELVIDFRKNNNEWLINRFTTKNMFSRPVDYWHSDAQLYIPDGR